jgi:predicted outer membrane repeat protein
MRLKLLSFLLVLALIFGFIPSYPGVANAQTPTPPYPIRPLSSQNFVTHTSIDPINSSFPKAEPKPQVINNWTTILSEDFEGDFPGPWQLFYDGPAVYSWGKRSCRPFEGSYSGWALGGGTNGAVLNCSSNYPNNATGWMVYGPFSLADATAADLSYKLWLNSEVSHDYIAQYASIDGANYYGESFSGTYNGWTDKTFDLANVYTLGNLIGQPQVWIALVFVSDSATTYSEGAYVDNILLRKNLTPPPLPPVPFSKSSPTSGSQLIPTNPTLSWAGSAYATAYEYCYDTSNNNNCTAPATWISAGANTSAALSRLAYNTTYYWQVRAINDSGTTYADGDPTAYWSFTTQAPPPPAIIRVRVNGVTNGSCGANWASACELQYALQSIAVSGDELWVAAGIYTPTTSTDRYATFQLRSGIAVYGGFAGTESTRDVRNFTTNITVLSGNIGDSNISDDNSYHVVTGSGTDLTAVLDGFTITAGNADLYYETPHYLGAGVFNNSGNPTFSNLIISNNTALSFYGSGGGMYNNNSNPVLTNVTFSNNSVSYDGGGMLNISSNPSLTNVTFNGNSATGSLCGTGTCGRGGAIENSYSNPTLTNVTFSNNWAHYYGGGIYITGIGPMTHVLFYNNSARFGGGIYGGGNITLTDVIFDHNTASDSGGGMNSSGSPTFNKVTFKSNTAITGGGIDIYSGSPTFTNVSFIGNNAGWGGGLSSTVGTNAPILTNVTFNNNSATNYGGAIYKNTDITGDGNLTIHNSILWGDSSPEGSELYEYPFTTTISDSVVQGGFAGGLHIITASPQLSALADWGGNTPTVSLLPGSSAIDEGNPANCPAQDQRGMSRVRTCDIGAFESQGFTLAITGGNNQAANPGFLFSNPLQLSVTANHAGEPVNGGVITFTAPSSGASVVTVTQQITITGGSASAGEIANGTAGSYQVSATASGANSVNFNLTNSGKVNTTILLTSTPNPAKKGQSVKFTATLTVTQGTPTGNVTFYDSDMLLGSGSVNANGVAMLTISTLSEGSHPITAQYEGDKYFAGSTSSTYIQTIHNDCPQCLYMLYLPIVVR